MSIDTSSDLHLIIVLLCIFVGVLTCLIISLRLIRILLRYPRRKDSPVDLLSTTGKWTHDWVGERIHGRIREVSDINLSKMKWGRSMSADFSLESLTLTWHSAWLVNASPFSLVIRAGKFVHVLPPTSFSKGSIDSESDFSVQVMQTETFVTVTSEDWQRKPPEPDSTQGSVTYDSDVARFALLPSEDGSSQGWLKLVRGGRGALLLCWSPPHIRRGIPIDEFVAILSSAQEKNKPSRRVRRTSTERIFSQALTSKKVPQVESMNMYQICNQMVLPLASSKDSSYAELFTDYGLPDIFISHVWSTRASETLKAIRCLSDLNAERKVTGDSPRRKSSLGSDLRLWFCTFCNNQSRVSQELGDDVQSSPFAQVLGVVDTIAILEPLVALKRKWCNFELVLAKQLGRSVHMVTSGGVVGAGQVTPKVLEEMSLELIGFNCKDATCASDEDAIRIDSAVCQMGGYDKLTAEVCAVFLDSISQASETMHRALNHAKSSSRWSHIQSKDDPSHPVLDCMERGWRCKEEDLPEANSSKTLVPRLENGKLTLWL